MTDLPRPPGISRILVVVDPTADSHPSVEKAARIALRSGAELELYICDVEQDLSAGSGGPAESRGARHARYLDVLERLAAPLRAQGLTVTVHTEWHAPLEQGIAVHVIRTHPDLVVKDSQRHPLPSRGPVTLTDWLLMRQLPAPLLLVRPRAWSTPVRIAVSADPCRPAERPPALDGAMLDAGIQMSTWLQADMQVLHVLRPPPHLPGETVSPEIRRQHHEQACAAVERLVAERNTSGRRIHVQFEEGKVGERITQFAHRAKTDILVMGSAGRPRRSAAGASGTAAQVLADLSCDLLVVKPPGFVSPLLVTDE